jgi:hypothetical protein
MSEAQTAPNLEVLHDAYEILGELRSGDRVGTYLARRRADGLDVVITVVQEPKGGENNSLNLFAADTQLLSQISHPHFPQVIEGRWVGKDQFAVVSKRYQTETLDERLARGEEYSPPRIAEILREVDAALEWGRENGIVHRGVTPDTLSFETGSNRALIVFEPTPIPIEGVPDAGADARTIGMLAWAMLTGERYAADGQEGHSLAELRPTLAKRVVDDTEAMVRSASGESRDVATFIAVVAAADELRAGELEIAEMQAEILEARRDELARFENEQRACAAKNAELQDQLAEERKEFERKMADEEAQLAAVKAEFADLKAREEEQLAAERVQFEHERDELARDREAFERQVAEREAELAAKHADVDRIRAEEGKRIDAAIAAAVQTVAETAVTPPPEQTVETATRHSVASDTPVALPAPWIEETVRKHSVGTGQPAVVERSSRVTADGASVGTEGGVEQPATRRRWAIPISIAALIILLVGLFATSHHSAATAGNDVRIGGSTIVPTAPTTAVGRPPRGGFLTQTAGGSVAPATPPAGPPVSPTATSSPAAAPVPATTQATTPTTPTSATPTPKPKPAPRRAVTDSSEAGNAFSAEADAIRRAEAARRARQGTRDSTTNRDTVVRRDSMTVPPPDTVHRVRR